MKIDKNKIVFVSVIVIVLAFMIGYYVLVMSDTENEDTLQQTAIPELEEQQEVFTTKKEAIDAIEDKRERTAPSIYDEKLLDSTGLYNPDLLNQERQRVVDSIYKLGRIKYTEPLAQNKFIKKPEEPIKEMKADTLKKDSSLNLMEMALEQQLFFAVSPAITQINKMSPVFEVEVDGVQVIQANDRLQMRISKDVQLGNLIVKRNTLVYGIVKFKPNRVVLEVDNINHYPIGLTAFDLADGLEGIYIKNSFRADVSQEVLGDVIDDVNIPGVPQVRGIKRVFQRTNRNVKVTVNNNYKLILKSRL